MKHDSDETSIVRCIICGETLEEWEIVRYVGAVAHASCAAKSVEEHFEGFDKRPFYIGSMGTIIALVMYIPMFLLAQDGGFYALAFAGIAIGLVVQSVGFLGIWRSYQMPHGIILFTLALLTSAAYSIASVLMATFGNDPQYYNDLGQLIVMAIPGMGFFVNIAYLMTGFLMVFLAVAIFLLEGVISEGIINRIMGIIMIVLVAFIMIVPFAFILVGPVNVLIEFVFVSFIFLTAEPPRDWGEVSELHTYTE